MVVDTDLVGRHKNSTGPGGWPREATECAARVGREMSEVCQRIVTHLPYITQVFLRRTQGFRQTGPAIDKRQSNSPRQAGGVPE